MKTGAEEYGRQLFPFSLRIRCGRNYEKIRAENVKIIIVFTIQRADAAWESGLGTGTEQGHQKTVLGSYWSNDDIREKCVRKKRRGIGLVFLANHSSVTGICLNLRQT